MLNELKYWFENHKEQELFDILVSYFEKNNKGETIQERKDNLCYMLKKSIEKIYW